MASNDSEIHPFRNGNAGTEAQRASLLRNRRDELATMSHSIRKVYVSRLSRIWGSLLLSLGGSVLIVSLFSESVKSTINQIIPGQNPAPLATALLATWILAAFFFLLGRSFADFRFNLAMSRAVLPTQELHGDVARLQNETPDAVGKRMARRLEVASRLAPVLAIGVAFPATLLAIAVAATADAHAIHFLERSLVDASSALAFMALLTTLVAGVMALRPQTQWGLFTALSLVSAPLLLLASGSLSVAIVAAGLALLGFAASRSQKRHANENAQINQEGTPLPAIFSLKTAIKNTKASCYKFAKPIYTFCVKNKRAFVCAVLLLGGTAAAFPLYSPEAPTQTPAITANISPGTIAIPTNPSETPRPPQTLQNRAVRAAQSDYGVKIDLHFAEATPIVATHTLNGATLPNGFAALVTLTMTEGDRSLFVDGLPGNAPRNLTPAFPTVDFEHSNCSGSAIPLQLVASPYGEWPSEPTKAALRYEVQLTMITCP